MVHGVRSYVVHRVSSVEGVLVPAAIFTVTAESTVVKDV